MATLFVMQNVCGEDKFGQQKERWLQIAQENMPTLQKRVVEPLRVVEAVKDEKVFQGWTYKTSSFRLEDYRKFADLDTTRLVPSYVNCEYHVLSSL